MPTISYSRAPLCSGYWGWQGGVCWVIKLLGCHAAGSSILCSAPGRIWPKVIQQCAWLWWLLLRPRCGAQERGFSLNWTAWRMVEKGECIGNCPEYHHQAYCNVYCLLPSPDYCRAFWEVSILPPPARDSDPCRRRLRSKEPLFIFDTSCLQIFFQRLLTACSYKKCPESLNQCRTDPLQIASC